MCYQMEQMSLQRYRPIDFANLESSSRWGSCLSMRKSQAARAVMVQASLRSRKGYCSTLFRWALKFGKGVHLEGCRARLSGCRKLTLHYDSRNNTRSKTPHHPSQASVDNSKVLDLLLQPIPQTSTSFRVVGFLATPTNTGPGYHELYDKR